MNAFKSLAVIMALSGSLANATSIESLKQEVFTLAKQNMTNIENRPLVRQHMEQLTSELMALAGPVTEEIIFEFSPGGWQQLWADEADMSPPGAPAQDLSQIYQYVHPQGWGFNFGLRRVSEDFAITFALAVSGSIQGNLQTTRINRAYSRGFALIAGESLAQLSREIEYGTTQDFVFRDAGRFPDGPIGAESVLTILYLDHDLKIGTAPNVYTGEIEMFVLERTDSVRAL